MTIHRERGIPVERSPDSRAPREGIRRWASAEALIAHLVGFHHAFARAEAQRIARLATETRDLDVRTRVLDLAREIAGSLRRREQVFFPAILERERAQREKRPPRTAFRSSNAQIRRSVRENARVTRAVDSLVASCDRDEFAALRRSALALREDWVIRAALEELVLTPWTQKLFEGA
jgi:iron-sulfur cluster repair protein YtfE (RIC family)